MSFWSAAICIFAAIFMLADNTNKYFSQLSWSGWKLLPHIPIEDCRGCWLRGCCSSVADQWWLIPRFGYWQLPAFSLSSILASRLLNLVVNYCCILTVLTVMQWLLSWLMHRWGRVPDSNLSLEIYLCQCLIDDWNIQLKCWPSYFFQTQVGIR